MEWIRIWDHDRSLQHCKIFLQFGSYFYTEAEKGHATLEKTL